MTSTLATNTSIPEIYITEKEEQLFTLFKSIIRHFDLEHDTTLRIVGGWVRGKILGQNENNNDIDIVLENISIQDFSHYIKQYTREHNMSELIPHRIVYVPRNVEKMRHFETVIVDILGFRVDISELNSADHYDVQSLPISEKGINAIQHHLEKHFDHQNNITKDVLLRDFTINTLFYNLKTHQVEDYLSVFSGTSAICDLIDFRILRTPQHPRVTLVFNPLRILRALRFTAQLNLSMEPTLRTAIQDHEIKGLLRDRVSRERIGNEMSKIMSLENAYESIQIILECDLGDIVLGFRPDCKRNFKQHWRNLIERLHPETSDKDSSDDNINSADCDDNAWIHTIVQIMRIVCILTRRKTFPSSPKITEDEEDVASVNIVELRKLLYFACLMLPFNDQRNGLKFEPFSKINYQQINTIVVKELCLSKRYAHQIQRIINGAHRLHYIVSRPEKWDILTLAVLFCDVGQEWRAAFYLAIAMHISKRFALNLVSADEAFQSHFADTLEQYQALCDCDAAREIQSRAERDDKTSLRDRLRPMINSNTLISLFQKPYGPWISNINRVILQWQLKYPDENRDACLSWLNEHKTSLSELLCE